MSWGYPHIYSSCHELGLIESAVSIESILTAEPSINKTDVERRQTLGRLRSINPNMISGRRLVVLAWMRGELWWHGHYTKCVNVAFQDKFDLEGQGHPPPPPPPKKKKKKKGGNLTKLFCIFFLPNVVVLAWAVDDLSRGQPRGWRTQTDRHAYASNDNTRRPKLSSGKKWSKTTNWMDGQPNIHIITLLRSYLTPEMQNAYSI